MQGFEHPECGAVGKQPDLEGAAAKHLMGVLLGFAAGCKDEVLDAENIALNRQALF